MTKQLSARVMVCSEYQRLLEESARAGEAWSTLQAEICWARLIPKKTVHELLRLRATYARAYTLLQKHVHSCGDASPCRKLHSSRQTRDKFFTVGSATFTRTVNLII
jgi:hypothetical protein